MIEINCLADLKKELNFMPWTDLKNYANEVLVPMAVSLAGFDGSSSPITQSMVQYSYLDGVPTNRTDTLRLNIIKVTN